MARTPRRLVLAAMVLALLTPLTELTSTAAAEPTIDIGINDLVDGQTVNLTITGFDPNTQIIAGQCDAAISDYDQIGLGEAGDNCQLGNSVMSKTDSEGTWSASFTFDRVIEPFFGGSIDCSVPVSCVLGATTYTSTYSSITFRSIATRFVTDGNIAPGAEPVDINLEVDGGNLVPKKDGKKDGKKDKVSKRTKTVSKGGLSITDVAVNADQASATIDFTCNEPMQVTVKKVAAKQKRKGSVAKAAAATRDTVSCDGDASIEVSLDNDQLRRGSVRLQVVLRGAEKGQKAIWKTKVKAQRNK